MGAPADCLLKREKDMTLNEWYRMHGLFLEAKMAFVVQEQIEALETDINNKNELIEGHEDEAQLKG